MNESLACVADVFHFFQPNEIIVRRLFEDVVLCRHVAPPAKTRRKRRGADIVLLARDLQAFNYLVRHRTKRLREVETVVNGDVRKQKGWPRFPEEPPQAQSYLANLGRLAT